jgi:hypothetical protein
MRDRRLVSGAAGVIALAALGLCVPGCSSDDPGGNGGPANGLGGTGGVGTGGGAAIGGFPGTGGVTGTGGGAAAGAGGAAAAGGSSGASGIGGMGGVTGGAGATAGAGASSGMGGMGGNAGAGTGGTTMDAGTGDPADPVFSMNVKLNDDTGRARQTEVALAAGPDGLVLAGWMDERANRVCAFSFSTDGGMTWSANVSIANASGGSFVGDPAVAIDGGGTMYAVCQQYLSGGSSGYSRMMISTDKGESWSMPATVQNNPDKPWAGGGVDDGVVFVSWLGNPGGIKRSLDHGMTWGETQSLGRIIHGTAIVTSTTGLVHVPYNLDSQRNQLRYLRSTDNGDSWEQPVDLLPDMGTFCFQCNPRQHPIVGAGADPTGKIVAITWASDMPAGEGDDDVWLLYSKDGGETWTDPIRVNDNETRSRQFEPWVAVDRHGRVHVAWTDFRNGQNETWYARSEDPTEGFEPNIQVTDDAGSGNTDFLGDYKGIVVQGPDVLIVWQDTRNDSGDIYFARAPGAAGP